MPLLGSANLGRSAYARCASVRIGRLASAEAPAAKRKKLRREIPVEATPAGARGSTVGYIGKTPWVGNGIGQTTAPGAERQKAGKQKHWGRGIRVPCLKVNVL